MKHWSDEIRTRINTLGTAFVLSFIHSFILTRDACNYLVFGIFKREYVAEDGVAQGRIDARFSAINLLDFVFRCPFYRYHRDRGVR